MRPIPAPRLGDAHGLLRAVNERERLRLDEFVTEFELEELFPPGLENALGRTRQFVSFARAAGLLNEDRGTVELTEMGKRYVRAGDAARPFDVAPAQAEWLRRLLRERHMTDSIYHGAAVALSLYASNPPDFRASALDFGRAISHLGRAGWDNENTFASQGERYTTFLLDLELIDGDRRLTDTGRQTRDELTLPIHASLKDLAGQLNPGGLEAAIRDGAAEAAVRREVVAEPEPVTADARPEATDAESEYEDVGPGAGPSPAAAPQMSAAMPAVPPPAAGAPPTPPPDVWDTAAPDERTRAYRAITPDDAAGVDQPVAAADSPAGATAPGGPQAATAPGDPHAATPLREAVAPQASAAPAAPPPPAPAPPPPAPAPPPPAPAPPPPARAPISDAAASVAPSQGEPPGASAPAPLVAPAAPVAPPPDPGAATVASPMPGTAPAFVSAAAIRRAAEEAGLRLPASLYAVVSAALTEGHVVLVGPAGSGKTTLALAIAKAAAQAGRSSGATVVTATDEWSAHDTVGRPGDEEWERGTVVDAAARGRWLVVDELDRAPLDRALGALSSFLGGVPVTLPDGETGPPDGWRLVATAGRSDLDGSPALVRRFAHVRVPAPDDATLEAAIDGETRGDAVAAAAVKRLLGARDLGPVGAGAFLAAARFAAARNATATADEHTLAREALAAHIAPLLRHLDDEARRRLAALAG